MVVDNNTYNLFRKAFLASFFVFVASLPISTAINSISLILLSLISIAYFIYSGSWQNIRLKSINIPALAFVLFYLWTIAGILYSTNITAGFRQAELLASFILVPVSFYLTPVTWKEALKKRVFLLTFSFAVLGMAILCEINELYELAIAGEPLNYIFFWRHSSYNLTDLIGLQPTYFAIFIILSISYLLIIEIKTASNKKWKLFTISSVLFLTLFQFQLANTTGLIFLIAELVILIPWLFIHKIRHSILTSFCIIICMISVGYNTKWVRQKLSNRLFQTENSEIRMKLPPRIERWEAALSVSKHNLLLGAGTGDIKDELIKQYREHELSTDAKYEYNAHNQYIQSLAANGIIGLVALLFVYLSHAFLFRKKTLALIFILSFMFFSINESILRRQKGVILLVAISTLFTSQIKPYGTK